MFAEISFRKSIGDGFRAAYFSILQTLANFLMASQFQMQHSEWLAKISAIQREKIGAEEWNEIVQRSETMRTAVRAGAKSCSATCRLREVKNGIQTSLDAMAQVRMQHDASASNSDILDDYEQISVRTEALVLHSSREEGEEAELSRWAAERQLIPAAVPSNSHNLDNAISFDEFRAIPVDEAEERAKFQLYETFAQACEQIRGQIFAFYDENKAHLGPRVCAAMAKTLADIDRADNLGAPEPDAGTWFVLGMARQVDANATMMMRVLADFGRRLELLAAAEQSCPVCLEGFEAEARPPAPHPPTHPPRRRMRAGAPAPCARMRATRRDRGPPSNTEPCPLRAAAGPAGGGGARVLPLRVPRVLGAHGAPRRRPGPVPPLPPPGLHAAALLRRRRPFLRPPRPVKRGRVTLRSSSRRCDRCGEIFCGPERKDSYAPGPASTLPRPAPGPRLRRTVTCAASPKKPVVSTAAFLTPSFPCQKPLASPATLSCSL